jgi:hypothetical protein
MAGSLGVGCPPSFYTPAFRREEPPLLFHETSLICASHEFHFMGLTSAGAGWGAQVTPLQGFDEKALRYFVVGLLQRSTGSGSEHSKLPRTYRVA